MWTPLREFTATSNIYCCEIFGGYVSLLELSAVLSASRGTTRAWASESACVGYFYRYFGRNNTNQRLAAYMIPPHRRAHPFFPKILPHAPNTLQTPPHHRFSWVGRLKRTLWVAGRRLKERDTKFALKVGMATSLLALPAFLESTRPTFVEYWGDWALISVSYFLSAIIW